MKKVRSIFQETASVAYHSGMLAHRITAEIDAPLGDRERDCKLAAAGLSLADFAGLSVYQDVVLGGQTVLSGVRNCWARWKVMAPQMPHAGAVLDVGSNFGWFGLQLLGHSPDVVVASVEANERSSAIQRRVLASHDDRRMCLLTRRAGLRQLADFAAAGQRFSAALCLSVLHWMPEHREFLSMLGGMCDRLFLEMPDVREVGSGEAKICAEIGEARDYLQRVFPAARRELLGQAPNHRFAELPRELWLIEMPNDGNSRLSEGLDAFALLENDVSWPPRSWWHEQLAFQTSNGRLTYCAHGLRGIADRGIGRLIRGVPDQEVNPRRQRWRRRARAVASRVGLI